MDGWASEGGRGALRRGKPRTLMSGCLAGGTGYSDVRAIKDPPPLTWK